MSSYASVAILLEKIPYGETTLAKFVSAGGWATEDLYPIVAALSVGQRALIRMGQLEAVLKYNSPSKPIEELNEVLDGLEAELTDENGEFQVIPKIGKP